MPRSEINLGQRYSSYAYSYLPHTPGLGLGGKLRHFKEQGASSWWSNEGRKADSAILAMSSFRTVTFRAYRDRETSKKVSISSNTSKGILPQATTKIWPQMVEKKRSELMRTKIHLGRTVPTSRLTWQFVHFSLKGDEMTLTISSGNRFSLRPSRYIFLNLARST